MSEEPIIVGIDPGSTSAVAALNMEGKDLLLKSRREFSRHEIINEIIETGYPVVVATDREEMPSTVEKIASSLGTEKFEPEKNLSRKRKNRLGKGKNSHEKDAYASAIHAFKQMSKTIRKVRNKAERKGERKKMARRYFL